MVRNIKRLSLALLALGLSAPVLADSSPFCVTVPNQQGGFSVGADILWLRPSASNTTYNISSVTPPPFLVTTTDVQSVNPSYHWAFDITAAYRIPCTGNDISVLWTHMGTDSSSDDIAFTTPGTLTGVTTVDGSVDYKYDAVDLDLGQRVNFGDYFNFRIFAGVRGVNTEENFDRTQVSTEETGGVATTTILDQNSKFRGFGPQMGIEGRYCLGYGFGIDAGTTLSALVGRTDNSATYTAFTSEAPTVVATIDVSADRKNRVVPALDMNLGADYTFNFNNCSRSSLVIQAGYKVIHYWGAHDLLASTVDSTAFIPTAGFNNASSVSFDGPYLGLKVNV